MKTFKQLHRIPHVIGIAGLARHRSLHEELAVGKAISNKSPIIQNNDEMEKYYDKYHGDLIRNKLSPEHRRAISDYTDDGFEHINKSLYNGNEHQLENERKDTLHNLKHAISQATVDHDMHVFSGLNYSPEHHFKQPDGHGKLFTHQLIHMHIPAFTSTSLRFDVSGGFVSHQDHKSNFYTPTPIKYIDFDKPEHEIKPYDLIKTPEDLKAVQRFHELRTNYTKTPEEHQEYIDMMIKHPGIENTRKLFHILKIHVPKGSHGLYVEPHTVNTGEHEMILHPGAQLLVAHPPDMQNNKLIWHAKLIHDGIKPTTGGWDTAQRIRRRGNK